MLIWFPFFWLLNAFLSSSDPTTNCVNQLQWKPFSMEDVRNLKTVGLAQNHHVQISTLHVWNKNWKKRKKNFFEAPYRGHPFEEWVPLFSLSTLLTCFAICCLSVTCWLNGWLLTPTCAQTGRQGRCVLNEVYCGDCWKVNPFPDVPATVLW